MKNKATDFEVGKIYIINYTAISYEQIRNIDTVILEGTPVIVKEIDNEKITVELFIDGGENITLLPENLYKGELNEQSLQRMEKRYKQFLSYKKIKMALFVFITMPLAFSLSNTGVNLIFRPLYQDGQTMNAIIYSILSAILLTLIPCFLIGVFLDKIENLICRTKEQEFFSHISFEKAGRLINERKI